MQEHGFISSHSSLHARAQSKWWRNSFLLSALCLVPFYVFMVVFSINEVSVQTQESTYNGPKCSNTTAAIKIEIWIFSVDTIRRQVEADIYFFPTPPLISPNGGLSTPILTDLHFYREIHPAGSVMKTARVTFPIFMGNPFFYPFGVYHTNIDLTAINLKNGTSLFVESIIVVKTPALSYDVLPQPPNRKAATFASMVDTNLDSMHSFEVIITRTDYVMTFSVILVLVLWGLSISVSGLCYSFVYLTDARPNAAYLSLGPIMLIAIPNLRASQPGVPPLGIILDVLGFYWNMILISISSVTLISVWIKRRNCPNML